VSSADAILLRAEIRYTLSRQGKKEGAYGSRR